MSPDKNADLLSAYRTNPTLRNRNRAVAANLSLVKKAADRFAKLSRISFDDLYSVGCVGLIKAVERFDLSKGNKFSSFAMPTIMSEMQHERRKHEDLIAAPRNLTDDYNALQRAYKKMLNLGVLTTYSELAESMGIDLVAVSRCRAATHSCGSLDGEGATENPDTEPPLPLGDGDDGWLHAAIKTLPNPQRGILIRYYLANESLAAIALSMSIGLPTVKQWLAESIRELQRHAGIEHPADEPKPTQPKRPAETNFVRGRDSDRRANVRRGGSIAPGNPKLAAIS